MLGTEPAAEEQIDRGVFYNTYIKKSESFVHFWDRVQQTERELRRSRPVPAADLRDAMLRGAAYHATWEAGDEPRPIAIKSALHPTVDRFTLFRILKLA